MALGDAAVAAGYTKVNGATDLVKDGDDAINQTRDWIAGIKTSIPAIWGITQGGTGAGNVPAARTALGLQGAITISAFAPSGGNPGDIHFQYTP